jgi:hypothetical protein
MNKAIKTGLLLMCALALMGCLETVTLVHVNKDGSGTIEQSVVISNSFKELMLGFGGSEEDFDLLDKEELESKAASFGSGVRFVSAEALETESGSGYKAVYAFDDITAVRVNQNPGDNLPTPDSGQEGEEPEGEFLSFAFRPGRPGKTAWLTVRRPELELEDSQEEGEPEASAGSSEEIPDMLKDLYRDMRIEIALEVEGDIVETNATYAEGSRVTYMALDFGKLLESEETFTRLMESNPESLEELKELIRDYPGIQMELEEEVRIGFK